MSRADIAPARVRPRRWSVAVGGALLSITLATGGCSVAEEPGQTGGTEAGNTYLEGVLASPSQTSADPLAADIQFAGLLLRNHRDAIQQSDEVLGKDGVDQEIRATAERMKSEHEERARRLESMLEGWGVPSDDVRGAGAESTPSAQPESTEDAEPTQIVGDELMVIYGKDASTAHWFDVDWAFGQGRDQLRGTGGGTDHTDPPALDRHRR